jgi:hypothetical protein
MRIPIPKATVPGIALALCTATLALWPTTDTQAATAPAALVVNASTNLRPVTHVASGGLYGLSANGTPALRYVAPLHPSTFVQMAPGGSQLPNGEPAPAGDALVVAREAAAVGAKVIIRMPDWYANFPYRWVSWSDWLSAVDKQIALVKASHVKNILSWEIWNEPDWTWDTAHAGPFNEAWVRTYNEIRSKLPDAVIEGPSFGWMNPTWFSDFLTYAKAHNALPDIIAWHALFGAQTISSDVAQYRAIEAGLGISPRRIVIEEYAGGGNYGTPNEIAIPGAEVGYIAKFERAGVYSADLAFWNQYGTMGDTLVSTGGLPNASWWLYKWYGDMSGEMVSTVPPAQTGIDGAAAVNFARNKVSVIFGGGSGSTAVTVNGLTGLRAFHRGAHVVLQYVRSQGRTTPVSGTQTISVGDYSIINGSITVPIDAMNPADGYHLVITPTGRTQH